MAQSGHPLALMGAVAAFLALVGLFSILGAATTPVDERPEGPGLDATSPDLEGSEALPEAEALRPAWAPMPPRPTPEEQRLLSSVPEDLTPKAEEKPATKNERAEQRAAAWVDRETMEVALPAVPDPEFESAEALAKRWPQRSKPAVPVELPSKRPELAREPHIEETVAFTHNGTLTEVPLADERSPTANVTPAATSFPARSQGAWRILDAFAALLDRVDDPLFHLIHAAEGGTVPAAPDAPVGGERMPDLPGGRSPGVQPADGAPETLSLRGVMPDV